MIAHAEIFGNAQTVRYGAGEAGSSSPSMLSQAAKPHHLASPAERPIHLPSNEITLARFQPRAMPDALVRRGRAVALPVPQAFALACKEAPAFVLAQTVADTPGFAEAIAYPEALPHPQATADAKIFPNPKVIPDTQAHPGPET
jgi:hypothetical protein